MPPALRTHLGKSSGAAPVGKTAALSGTPLQRPRRCCTKGRQAPGPQKEQQTLKIAAFFSGRKADRAKVDGIFELAAAWSASSGVPSWVGAWMPYDNTDGDLSQAEVGAFACYFSFVARKHGVPWSLNDLSKYYDVAAREWLSTAVVRGVRLEMPPILAATACAAPP